MFCYGWIPDYDLGDDEAVMHSLVDFVQRLYHFEDLIRWGGHLVLTAIIFSETGLMAGFFLPGDSLLVTAGVIAAAGYLNVGILLTELCLAAILGDSFSYAVGRQIGPRLFKREDSLLFKQSHLRRTEAFYEKYGAKTIVLARFIPIIRTFAPVVAGIGRMNYRRFVTYNIAGGIGWVCLMILGGYSLGRFIPHIDRQIHKVIFVVIVVSFIPFFTEYRRSRRGAA